MVSYEGPVMTSLLSYGEYTDNGLTCDLFHWLLSVHNSLAFCTVQFLPFVQQDQLYQSDGSLVSCGKRCRPYEPEY